MKWAYDLCGAEMIIKDEPIYDATTIVNGELMQLGASSYTAGADAGLAFISAGAGTVTANTVANGIGICLETKTTASSPSIAAVSSTLGGQICYGKTIINPFAVYRAAVEVGSTAVSGALSVAAGVSASTVAAITVTGAFSVTAHGIGNWLIFTATAGPNYGTIRRVQACGASAGSADIDVAFEVAPSTDDKVILVQLPHSGAGVGPNSLTPDGTKISGGDIDGADSVQVGMAVVDNYIDRGNGIERLTTLVHAKGSAVSGRMNAIAARVPMTIYTDVVVTDHVYNQ
jgi:hypothetical protein